MAVPVVMPHMGESVVEGKITRWLKHPGDAVAADEPLVEIETDKISVEVPAPTAGVLLKILAEEGATVKIDQQIALVGEATEAPAEPPPKPEPKEAAPPPRPEPRKKPARPPAAPGPAPMPAAAPKKVAPPARGPEPPPPPAVPKEDIAPATGPVPLGTFGVLATPAVRRFAREQGVDLGEVEGTGRMGRITREDVEAFLARLAAQEAAPAPEEAPAARPATPREARPGVDEELVPLSPMRRAIAEHMVRSRRDAPHVTTVAEVDMTDAAALRDQLKADFAAQGVKLTYTALLFSAVARALKEFPDLNAQWTDQGILVKYRIHLGMAVAVEEGLVVPVVRDADRLSLLGLARAIQTLAEKTRQGKVAPADLEDGTFTITNPGVFGAVISTPIIHQPQAAILATGRIADVPAVWGGGLAIRKHMFLSLSYDHRVVDGATAQRFLQRIREILEKPDFERPRGSPA